MDIRGRLPTLESTCVELERLEACAKTFPETLGNFVPYNLCSYDKTIAKYLLLDFNISLNFGNLNLISLIDTGAISNYMSYDTATKLGLYLELDDDVVLANGINITS